MDQISWNKTKRTGRI